MTAVAGPSYTHRQSRTPDTRSERFPQASGSCVNSGDRGDRGVWGRVEKIAAGVEWIL